jgi:transposase
MGRRSFDVRDLAEILEHWHRGRPIAAIGRSLGVDRKTIRKYAALAAGAGFAPGEGPGPPGGWAAWLDAEHPALRARSRRGPTVEELEGYREEILALLEHVTPTTAWRRLRAAERGERRLRASLASFRRWLHRCLPEHAERAAAGRVTVRRPDPPPGEEGQVDYGALGLWPDPRTGRRRLVHAFVLVLAHSRHLFARAVLRLDQRTWLECHAAAFTFFQGAPRRLVPDNLKSGVVRPDLYDPGLNRGYAELAQHYGCLIDPARAKHPRDKPRVERAMPYVRDAFWRGRAFAGLDEMNAALERWCLAEAGQRVHGTTGQRPLEVFRLVERPALLPLPAAPFEPAVWTQAVVGRDAHVQAGGAWYTVPYPYVGRTLAVRLTATLVQCYAEHRLVKTHPRVPKGHRRTDWDDYPPEKAAFFRRTPAWCREQAGPLGPAVAAAVAAALAEGTLAGLRQAQGLLRLGERYGAARLDAACARALAFGDPGLRTVRTVLERGLEGGAAPPEAPPAAAGAYLRGPAELLAAPRGREEGPPWPR